MKVLIIDDNKKLTDLFETTLTSNGYFCRVVNDDKKGLDIIKKKESDLILLDLAMPKFSGEDILKNLQKDGSIKDYKIYLITASVVSENEISEYMKNGILGCLRKPVRLDKLLETLQKHRK